MADVFLELKGFSKCLKAWCHLAAGGRGCQGVAVGGVVGCLFSFRLVEELGFCLFEELVPLFGGLVFLFRLKELCSFFRFASFGGWKALVDLPKQAISNRSLLLPVYRRKQKSLSIQLPKKRHWICLDLLFFFASFPPPPSSEVTSWRSARRSRSYGARWRKCCKSHAVPQKKTAGSRSSNGLYTWKTIFAFLFGDVFFHFCLEITGQIQIRAYSCEFSTYGYVFFFLRFFFNKILKKYGYVMGASHYGSSIRLSNTYFAKNQVYCRQNPKLTRKCQYGFPGMFI